MPCIWVNGELVPDPDALSDYSESPGASGSSPTKSAPRNRKSQLEVRLPSDQLQQLIHAINTPQNQETQTMTPGQAMPPPPLPAHARAAKAGSTGHVAQPSPDHVAQHAAGINIHQSTPRDESRGSDVSMHAGCTYFPNCTTEDDCGHVIHSSPAVTPSLIMGKKEGSSPAKRKVSFDHTVATSIFADNVYSARLHVHDPWSARPANDYARREAFHDVLV